MNHTLLPYYGLNPQGDMFRTMVRDIASVLPRVSRETVFQSIRGIAGQHMTPELIRETAWRLAGNLEQLQAGLPVLPWTHQRVPEWVPVRILSFTYHETESGRIGGLLRFRVLEGTPCPLIVQDFWSRELSSVVSRRIGFSAAWGKFPFRHPAELVQLRLLVLIDPSLCRMERPGFREIACPASLITGNRDVLRKRIREDPCPRGFTFYCYTCPVGYDQCPAGCHPETFVQQLNEVMTRLEGDQADAQGDGEGTADA